MTAISSAPSRRRSRAAVALLAAALVLTVLTRPEVLVGVALLGLVLVPLERAVPLKRQRVLRPGLVTDLTHLLLNTVPVAVSTVALVVATALPSCPCAASTSRPTSPGWCRRRWRQWFVLISEPYWGHRLTHQVPFLWRFHAVHHSIEHMDWLAAARLHPLDAGFTQACFALPLFALGYDAGLFAGVAAVVTALAIFQHANVRLRFPILRWVLPTPEWHHWHHATDAEAHDHNFGLPFVDRLFGTAYLPRASASARLRHPRPCSADSYLAQLRYSFARSEA